MRGVQKVVEGEDKFRQMKESISGGKSNGLSVQGRNRVPWNIRGGVMVFKGLNV